MPITSLVWAGFKPEVFKVFPAL